MKCEYCGEREADWAMNKTDMVYALNAKLPPACFQLNIMICRKCAYTWEYNKMKGIIKAKIEGLNVMRVRTQEGSP